MLWISPIFPQSLEIYRSIQSSLAPLVAHQNNGKELRCFTGGQIWFRSSDNPDSLRSLNYQLVISDESAFGEDCWYIVAPTLARSQGKYLSISTPSGHNHFYDAWIDRQTDPDWYCLQLPWSACPDLSPTEIEKQRRTLTPSKFRQEYEASFESPEGAIFDPDWLREDVIFVDAMPDSPQRGPVLGVDLSLGKLTSDWQAICKCVVKDNIVYVDAMAERMPISSLCLKIKAIHDITPCESIGIESNGFQVLVADELRRIMEIDSGIVKLIDNRVDKRTRISRLSTRLSRGEIKILKNAGGRTLRHQLCDFGAIDCKYDDLPDALEMAIRTLAET